MAAEEINAEGGLLGKRKIETIMADEAAGTDANVKELRRMKLSEGIDLFTGIISSGNTPALGPVAEELGLLTIFVDGCTDFLFDKAVTKPKYTFRLTNIQSADGITAAIGAAQSVAAGRARSPRSSPTTATVVTCTSTSRSRSRSWCPARRRCRRAGRSSAPPTSRRTSPRSDLRQAGPAVHVGVGRRLRGLLQAGAALRPVRQDEGRDHARFRRSAACHRQGSSRRRARRRARQLLLHLSRARGRWPINDSFVQRYYKRWNEYPSFQSDGAYRHALHAQGGDRKSQQARRRLARR